MNYNISIIVVNYNGRRYLENLFDSFLEMYVGDLTYEVIFVDNSSTDDSVEFLECHYKNKIDLKIIKSNKNLGFAGGNNLGVKNSSGEYVLFLNNDTQVERNWLIEMYNCIKNTNAGIVSSKLVFFYDFLKIHIRTNDKVRISKTITINEVNYTIDPKFCKNLLYEDEGMLCFGHSFFYIPLIHGLQTDYCFSFQTLDKNLSGNLVVGEDEFSFNEDSGFCSIKMDKLSIERKKVTLIQNAGSEIDENFNGYDIGFCEEDKQQYEAIRQINNACGAAMLMKREDFNAVGGFDDYFFMYYEDTDLSYKIKRLNKALVYCPGAIVRHIHTGSSKEWSPFFIYHVFRNRLLFILKNFTFYIFIIQFIKYTVYVIKEHIKPHQNKEVRKAKRRALFDVVRKAPHYLAKKIISKY